MDGPFWEQKDRGAWSIPPRTPGGYSPQNKASKTGTYGPKRLNVAAKLEINRASCCVVGLIMYLSQLC